jgi:hypothetical protein
LNIINIFFNRKGTFLVPCHDSSDSNHSGQFVLAGERHNKALVPLILRLPLSGDRNDPC